MRQSSEAGLAMPAPEAVATVPVPSRNVLTGILREGAQRLLARAIGAEVNDWISRHAELKDGRGRQFVVRNATTRRGRW